MCRLFFKSIDPLLKDRQGDDCGTRYRTGIYWENEADAHIIEEVYAGVQDMYDTPLIVEKSKLECFYSGEEYHQNHLVKNPEGYCHLTASLMKSARTYANIIRDLILRADEEKKTVLPKFFKTGQGEYGEGDRFLGVVVPEIRNVAKLYTDVSFEVLEWLLESEWHEVRLCALLILIQKYRKSPEEVVQFYISHPKGINNWNLVEYFLSKN